MSVTTTIKIEAENRQQLGEILSAIGRVLSGVESPTASISVTEDEDLDAVAQWYETHGTEFLARLTPNARRALEIIIESESEYVSFADVSASIDKRGTALAGTLASIGVATKSLNAPGPPFERDAKRKVYRMTPSVRRVLRTLASSPPDGREAERTPPYMVAGW
jgi:hypothetical protein